jgi:hypothetical protein
MNYTAESRQLLSTDLLGLENARWDRAYITQQFHMAHPMIN